MIAVNLAVVSIIFVPYFLLIYLGQHEYRKIINLFTKEAYINGLRIDVKDRWNLNAIGIDSTTQKLLFVQRRNEEFYVEVIHLASIAHCDISHHIKDIKLNGFKEPVLQRIELELVPLDGSDRITINLFDSGYTFDQDYEMKHAEKWRRIINSNISTNLSKRKVA